jgi:hypothetical protein
MAIAPASAESPPTDSRRNVDFEASFTAFHQPMSSIQGGGEFNLSSVFLRFKATRPVTPTTVVGLSVKYDIDDYDFNGLTEFGGLEPWNDVRRFGLGIPIFSRLGKYWSLGLSPSVDWLQEYGADSDDSMTLGTPVFLARSFARDKRLGLGAGIFRNVEDEWKVLPFIAIDWRFNENWRLSNPFEADVLGPAGLELSYTINNRWYLGGGGVYRSFRFRLDDEGVAPNGIGENEGIVSFLRLHRTGDKGLDLDIYIGATVEGRLELKDSEGDKLASSDYDPAPFVAVTFRGDF